MFKTISPDQQQICTVTVMISNILFVILFETVKGQIKKQSDEKKI